MTELFFVVCLGLASPDCQQKSLLYTDTTSQLCMMQAQSELAVWIGDHPSWSVRRYGCRDFDPSSQEG